MAQDQGFPTLETPFVGPGGRLAVPWYRLLLSLWNRTGGAAGAPNVPTGTVHAFAGSAAPDGFFVCDGTALSRETYSTLFGVIGTTWGAGDGSTTFNIPDLRGLSPLGVDGGHALGSTGGAASTTLGVGQLPAHTHTVTDAGHVHAVTDPGHSHTAAAVDAGSTSLGVTADGAVAGNTGAAVTGLTVDSATTGIVIDSTGSGDPVPTQSPYAAVIFIIKA